MADTTVTKANVATEGNAAATTSATTPDLPPPTKKIKQKAEPWGSDPVAGFGAAVGDTAEWVVLYHAPPKGGQFKGRAEFLRLMLEDAGVAYQNSAKNLRGPDGYADVFRGALENVAKDTSPFPAMFPPIVWHRPAVACQKSAAAVAPDADSGSAAEVDLKDGEVFINQVQPCMTYIGSQLGYSPSSAQEAARADSITANCMDYIAEGRRTFHPVADHASYFDQMEEGDRESKAWSEGRMKTWLTHFEKVLGRNTGPTSPVAGGAKVTYADFALFHVLDATVVQFNNKKYGFAWDKNDGIPSLKAFYEAFEKRERIAAYRASDRCGLFGSNSMM